MTLELKSALLALIILLFIPPYAVASPFFFAQSPEKKMTNVYIGFDHALKSGKFYDSSRALINDPNQGEFFYYQFFLSAERGVGANTSLSLLLSVTHNEVIGAHYEKDNDFKHTIPYGFLLSAKHIFAKEEHLAAGVNGRLNLPYTFDRDPAPFRWGDGRAAAGGDIFAALIHPAYLAEARIGATLIDEKPTSVANFALRGRYFPIPKQLFLDLLIDGEESLSQSKEGENPFEDTVAEQSFLNAALSLGIYILPLETLVDIHFKHSIVGRHYPYTRELGATLGFVF
ncbi:MAG: hypothetical protein Kow0090_07990 [Myxococcota bacterium]